MVRRTLLSKIFGLDPKNKKIDTLLYDPEIGEVLQSFLDEIDHLGKRISEITQEIEDAVRMAIAEGMGPSDIRTIIEVMVMGMQPGDASYLLPKDEGQNILIKAEPDQHPESSCKDFLKTVF